MKRRIMLRVLACLCLLLAGCGYYGLPKGEIVTLDKEKMTIRILAGQSTSDAGIDEMMEEILESKFENIDFEWECVDWGEKFGSQMTGKFATGDIPDIMIGKAQDVTAYAITGNLAPIPKTLSKEISETALKAVTYEGTVYGLPINTFYQGVIYNKTIFKEYGLEIPRTQEELENIVEILSAHEIVPFASHFQENWNQGNITMQFMINEIFNDNPWWGLDFRNRLVHYSDNEDIISCLEYSRFILDNTWADALIINQNEADMRFEKGEAAMYLTGTWSLQFVEQINPDIELGIFPYPNKQGDAKLIIETNITFMKSAVTEYEDIVDEVLLEIITNEELLKEILEFTQTNTALRNMEHLNASIIQEDIDAYVDQDHIINAALGNNQLVWAFQTEVAEMQLKWLKNEITLEEVLQFADSNRDKSINR